MSQSRKHRGYRTERVIESYLSQWWENASVGRGAGKDIHNVPFDCEIKARTEFQPLAWLKQVTKRASAHSELPFVVSRCNGQGEDAAEYCVVMRLGDLLPLLILKYGHLDNQPTEADIDRCSGCGSYMIRRCLTCQPMTTDANPAIYLKKSLMDSTVDQ